MGGVADQQRHDLVGQREVPGGGHRLAHDEDGGFDRGEGRLHAAPMITFSDPARAVAEVGRVLDAGARILVTIPGPAPDGDDGYVSPGHPRFDPIWRLIAEAGVPLARHAGLSGVARYGRFWRTGSEGGGGFEGSKHAAFPLVAFQDRGISDTFAALTATACSSGSPTCGWPRSRTAPCGCPTCCATCVTPGARCRSPSRSTPSSSSGARCGWPPTTRTTWTASRRRRSPLGTLLGSWRDGFSGALRMGAKNGAWCVGCCWALMASLFALGVMSVVWMAVAGLIAFEKTVPWRRVASYGTAAVLLGLGVLVLTAPGAIPGLTSPRDTPMQQMTPMESSQSSPL